MAGFTILFFVDPPGDSGKKGQAPYTFVCVPVFIHLQNAESILIFPVRLSRNRGLAGLLRPNPTSFGQSVLHPCPLDVCQETAFSPFDRR